MKECPGHASNDEDHEPGVQKAKRGKRCDGNPSGRVEPDGQQGSGDQSSGDGRQFKPRPS
jgi:hypothetical protein